MVPDLEDMVPDTQQGLEQVPELENHLKATDQEDMDQVELVLD